MFNANIATASGRNSDAVTLRALGGAAASSISIGQIRQLAAGARMTTSNTARTALIGMQSSVRLDSFANDHPLSQLGFSDDPADRNASISVNNQVVRLNQADVNAINWDEIQGTHSFTLRGVGEVTLTKQENGEFSFVSGAGDNEITGILSFDENGTAEISDLVFDEANENLTAVSAALSEVLSEQFSLSDEGELQRNGNNIEFVKAHVMQVDDADVRLIQRASGDVQFGGRNLDFFSEQTISLNGESITLRSNMTVNQMMTQFNNSNAGVRMTFESLTGRFNIERTTTGEESRLEIGADSVAFFNSLGIDMASGSTDEDGNIIFKGTNAEVFINGDLISSQSNTLTFSGVAITLNRTTDGVAYSGGNPTGTDTSGNIMVNISRDTAGVVDRVRVFVDAYNSIIQRIENLTRERKAPHEVSYGPLTDEEKSQMTDRQIEEWETIARRGIMRNDSALQNLAASLRRELFVTVEQVGLSPHQIGISTGTFHSGSGGQIVLDEERLTAALEEDPDRVANVFAGTEGNRGLLWRLNERMNDYVRAGGSGSRAIRNLEDSIKRSSEQVHRMTQRMFAEEDRLLRQFSAMESAMARMQSQGDWFGAMLGGAQR